VLDAVADRKSFSFFAKYIFLFRSLPLLFMFRSSIMLNPSASEFVPVVITAMTTAEEDENDDQFCQPCSGNSTGSSTTIDSCFDLKQEQELEDDEGCVSLVEQQNGNHFTTTTTMGNVLVSPLDFFGAYNNFLHVQMHQLRQHQHDFNVFMMQWYHDQEILRQQQQQQQQQQQGTFFQNPSFESHIAPSCCFVQKDTESSDNIMTTRRTTTLMKRATQQQLNVRKPSRMFSQDPWNHLHSADELGNPPTNFRGQRTCDVKSCASYSNLHKFVNDNRTFMLCTLHKRLLTDFLKSDDDDHRTVKEEKEEKRSEAKTSKTRASGAISAEIIVHQNGGKRSLEQ